MVVIRLSRSGSKARPFFNIVAADKRVRRDGAFIERLGFYNPNARGAEEGLRLAAGKADLAADMLAMLLASIGMEITGVWWAISLTSIAKGITSAAWFAVLKRRILVTKGDDD